MAPSEKEIQVREDDSIIGSFTINKIYLLLTLVKVICLKIDIVADHIFINLLINHMKINLLNIDNLF